MNYENEKKIASNLTHTADQLFFIVGSGRSGTTLLQVMISNHPDVIVAPETQFYSVIREKYFIRWGELNDRDKFKNAIEATLNLSQIRELDLSTARIKELCDTSTPSWETIFLSILSTLAEKQHVSRVGEKTPAHIHYLGLLSERYPKAKFIHVCRDPRAVICSQKELPRYRRTYYNIGGLCRNWNSKIAYHREFVDSLGPQRYLTVKYEDLVSNPETAMHVICDFINIEFSSKMLEHANRDFLGFSKNAAGHMTNTLKPVFKSSVDKWRSELTATQITLIEHALADDMNLLGYDPIQGKRSLSGLLYKFDVGSMFVKRLLDFVGNGINRKLQKVRGNISIKRHSKKIF